MKLKYRLFAGLYMIFRVISAGYCIWQAMEDCFRGKESEDYIMTSKEYKKLSVKEFTKAAEIYESDNAGVYTMCKKDYPDVLTELEKEQQTDSA